MGGNAGITSRPFIGMGGFVYFQILNNVSTAISCSRKLKEAF